VTCLLDTDALAQPAKRHGDPHVIEWLHRGNDRCYTSAVVIAQRAYWARTKQERQRERLQAWLTRLADAMQGRIHRFNVSVAHQRRAMAGQTMREMGWEVHLFADIRCRFARSLVAFGTAASALVQLGETLSPVVRYRNVE